MIISTSKSIFTFIIYFKIIQRFPYKNKNEELALKEFAINIWNHPTRIQKKWRFQSKYKTKSLLGKDKSGAKLGDQYLKRNSGAETKPNLQKGNSIERL